MLGNPPTQPIRLWVEGGRAVGIDDSWGPAVPYGCVDHPDGHQNHGYMRIKGDAEAARRIPETVDWPELGEFLAAVNAAESPIESVGCEKAFFSIQGQGEPTVKLGSYVDLIFTEAPLMFHASQQTHSRFERSKTRIIPLCISQPVPNELSIENFPLLDVNAGVQD